MNGLHDRCLARETGRGAPVTAGPVTTGPVTTGPDARWPPLPRAASYRPQGPGFDGVLDAMREVFAHELQRHGSERSCSGRDLGQDVNAVGVVLDHALQTADLALDTPQPPPYRFFVLGIANHSRLLGRSSDYTIPPGGKPVELALGAVSRTARLWLVLAANLALVAALAGVGIAANSLGVFAAGVDYLADAAAIGVSLLAVYLSNRPPSKRHPYGYPRATRLAAAVNAGWLLVLSCLVAAAAAYRLLTGEHRVDGLPVLVVSAVAALVMSGGAVLLSGGLEETGDEAGGEDLNLRVCPPRHRSRRRSRSRCRRRRRHHLYFARHLLAGCGGRRRHCRGRGLPRRAPARPDLRGTAQLRDVVFIRGGRLLRRAPTIHLPRRSAPVADMGR